MTRIVTMSPPIPPRPAPGALTGMTDQAFLGHLFTHGTGTRVEIARLTGISRPTISDAAARLLAADLIIEAGETPPRGRGRRAMLYRLNPEHGHVNAVVLERRHLVVRTLDFAGALRREEKSTVDLSFAAGIGWAREQLAAAATELGTPCLAATISVAAPVDPRTGAVQPMAGAPLGDFIPDITTDLGLQDVPLVRVDNDVNWAARAEATDPAKETGRSFLYVYLGAGIGGSLVAEGTVIRGANGAAGEISFLRTPGGRTLHTELASLSFGSPDGSSIDIDRALTAFRDPADEEAGYAAGLLAQAVLNAATVFDPGTVVLGGPLSAADPLVEQITTAVEAGRIAPLVFIRGRADDEALVTGVSRHAVHDAWDAASKALAPVSPAE